MLLAIISVLFIIFIINVKIGIISLIINTMFGRSKTVVKSQHTYDVKWDIDQY